MLKNHVLNESGRILRLNWVATGDQFKPLASSWSLHRPDENQTVGTPGLSEVCNPAVIEKCKTSRFAREGGPTRSLTMCGE
jgi:hypothetical protein